MERVVLGNLKGRDKYGSGLDAVGHFGGRLLGDGQWDAIAYKPVQVADSEKVKALLSRVRMRQMLPGKLRREQPNFSRALNQGMLWKAQVDYLKQTGRLTPEMEREFSGGDERWRAHISNILVAEGINYALDASLSGGTPITAWYVGLTQGSPSPADGDTLASHGGWVEETTYTGTRKAWTDGGVSAKSVSNSGSPAAFAITGPCTAGGAFLCSVTSGTAGTLYAAGAFTEGNRSLFNGDTLSVTATFTGADDGA